MKKTLVLVFTTLFGVGLLSPLQSCAQSKLNGKSFQDFVAQELHKWNVPGAAIAVVKEGEIIYAKGFGFKDKDKKLQADENTLFAIGSLTKSMTATSLGILVDKKVIKWDSKLVDLLPNFKLKDEFATQRINPVDLLCHRSGLPSHNMMWYVTDFPREDIVRRLRYLEPSKDFRTTFQYNPNMYTLAGHLVGQLSGSSWEEFNSKNIFQPLQMTRSNFTYMDMIKDPNHSRPYTEKDGEVLETDFHASQHLSAPAGSVNSSAKEMANWLIMNLDNGRFDEKQVVSSESLSYIQSPHITFPSNSSEIGVGPEGTVYSYSMYGLGWNIGTYYDQICFDHAGAIDGFSSQMLLLPRLNAGIVVLTNNQMGGDPFCASIINRVSTILMNREPFDFSGWLTDQGVGSPVVKSRTKTEPGRKSLRNLEAYVGEYTDDGYGTIQITERNRVLRLTYYRYDVDLQYVEFDIFKTVDGIVNRRANFLSNNEGKIDRLEIQWDRSVKPIVFYKNPPPVFASN